jgi:CspA family cold shock protein
MPKTGMPETGTPKTGMPGELGPRPGTVREFDEFRGLGTVLAADGTEYAFHCTQIADGTRRIEAGTAVLFTLRPGGLGRWEAAAIEKA